MVKCHLVSSLVFYPLVFSSIRLYYVLYCCLHVYSLLLSPLVISSILFSSILFGVRSLSLTLTLTLTLIPARKRMWDVKVTKSDRKEAFSYDMKKRVSVLPRPVKKRYGLMYPISATMIPDGERTQSGVEALQRTDMEGKEKDRKRALKRSKTL